jgi:hypothetical protein
VALRTLPASAAGSRLGYLDWEQACDSRLPGEAVQKLLKGFRVVDEREVDDIPASVTLVARCFGVVQVEAVVQGHYSGCLACYSSISGAVSSMQALSILGCSYMYAS